VKKYEPYQGTTVPVSRSQEAIRKMLMENGAVAFQFTEIPTEQMLEIKFARKVVVNGDPHVQPLRFRISYKNRRIQQVYRALVHHLKAKFEIVRFGIISFEEEFMPYFEVRLRDGRTVTIAEALIPNLELGLPPHLEPMREALPEAKVEEDD